MLKHSSLLGLLPFQIPYVDFSGVDYSNSHDAVGSTPPPPSLSLGDNWYKWYGEILPDEKEVAKVKKTYKAYLKWFGPYEDVFVSYRCAKKLYNKPHDEKFNHLFYFSIVQDISSPPYL